MANYPSSISTNANLYIAVNGLQTTLALACTSGDTTLTLTSTTGFPTTGLVTIDNTEVVSYTGVSGATITGCTRGADGTTAASHPIGVTVGLTVVAAHHNLLKDEIIAIETALGISLANVFPATPTTGSGNVVLATSPTLVTPNLGTPSAVNLANATNLPNSATTATPNATASTIMSRDANSNAKVNNLVENFSTTVTAAGTTILTVSSSKTQQFTGTSTQTVTLPDATTLSIGFQFTVLNRSTGAVAVNNNGGSLQKSIPASTQYIFTVTAIGTANGTWDVSSDAGTGTVTSVSGTTNQITSTGGTTPVLALANPITTPGGITITGSLTFSPTTAGIVGTTTNDNAASGKVGEYIESVVSSITAPTSLHYKDATSIALTAGDWDVSLIATISSVSTVTEWIAGISTTTGDSGTGLIDGSNMCDIFTTVYRNAVVPPYRMSLSGNTTVYLKFYAQYSGSPTLNGRLSARRVR